MTAAINSKNNNYAFEIRFVNDNIVQVFDIAAKRQHGSEATSLPTEYNQEEVLKGQLRYSKLVGSTQTSSNTLGNLEDDGQPYQHEVTTRKSKNRRSIQRNTFFMMGSGGVSSDNYDDSHYYDYNNDTSTQYLTTTHNKSKKQDITVVQTSAPPTPKPSSPTIVLSLASPANTVFPTQPTPVMLHTAHDTITNKIYHNNHISRMNQISPIIPPLQPPTIILPTQPSQQQYYTEDYTSMTMIDSNDYDSKKNIQHSQEQQSRKKVKRRGCCIIS